jgi:hypothetical protein
LDNPIILCEAAATVPAPTTRDETRNEALNDDTNLCLFLPGRKTMLEGILLIQD